MAILSTKVISNNSNPNEHIRGCCFLVKDYQRGYRWVDSEIKKLLDDIKQFESINGSKYCLQPIVVRECPESNDGRALSDVINLVKENNRCTSEQSTSYWELVDGQQRLTTILLIIDYCNSYSANYNPLPFSIRYSLVRPLDEYYFKKAIAAITDWFDKYGCDKEQVAGEIKNKLLRYVKIIWFVPDSNESSEQIFKKINVGRIRLTSADVFKAFLLNKENDIDEHKKSLKEISYEWDQLEKNLSDDDFWLFISNKNNPEDTRIDYLLNIYCKQILPSIKDKIFKDTDSLYSYLVISEYIEQERTTNPDIFLVVWDAIKDIYSKLYYWYRDKELYHYVGYLVATAGSGYRKTTQKIHDLIRLTDGKTKKESRHRIKKLIYKQIQGYDLDTLDYSDRQKVYNVLLLFNLLTMIQSNTNARFSFMNFKNKDNEDNKWDIEHIHSQADDEKLKTYSSPSARKALLEEYRQQFIELHCNQNDIQKVDDYISASQGNMTDTDWVNAIHDISNVFGDCDENGLGNLTLLPASVNRSYHNALFPIKRKTIIERAKGGEFIPVCTMNVFMKMYTEQNVQPLKWSGDDADEYRNAIKEAFDVFKNESNN